MGALAPMATCAPEIQMEFLNRFIPDPFAFEQDRRSYFPPNLIPCIDRKHISSI